MRVKFKYKFIKTIMNKIGLIGIISLCLAVFTACNSSKPSDNDIPDDTNEIEIPVEVDEGDTEYIEESPAINNEDADTSNGIDETFSYYYVIGNGVRMRKDASLDEEIILLLSNGTPVEYVDRKGDWFKVKYNNETGYIRRDLLSEEQPEDELPQETIDTTTQLPDNHSQVADNPKIIIKKGDRILELWDGDNLWGSYPIGLGQSPIGDKQKEGDGRTPEGTYYVCTRNSYSRFYLSLGVSYPNVEDAKEALDEGLINQSTYDQIDYAINRTAQPPWNTALGGEIMIHGHGSQSDWTAGCIAVDDDIMDILWANCPLGTQIIIEP